MKVVIACEFSGIVRDAFADRGHDAWSVDIMPSERPGNHIQGDICDVDLDGVDLLIAHPPCTYLAVSGARWWTGRFMAQIEAIEFARNLMDAPVRRVAVENPIGILSTAIRPPDQIIQPWMFGHEQVKATCLWLRNLPALTPTDVRDGRIAECHRMGPSPNRSRNRSRTYDGIAKAMAEQWG